MNLSELHARGPAQVPGRVSIIMPTFNSEEFLSLAIQSVIRQKLKDVEIIIHDGGSSDATMQIIQSFQPRLPIIANSLPDWGQSNALNRALAVASGEYIGWLNSDDEYAVGSVSALLEVLEKDETKLVAYGHHEEVDPDGTAVEWIPALPPWAWLMRNEGFVFNAQSALWRRRVHDLCGWFDESLDRTMDYDLMLRMLQTLGRRRFARIDLTVGRFRRHARQKTDGQVSTRVAMEHRYIQEKIGFKSGRNCLRLKPLYVAGRGVRTVEYIRFGGLKYAVSRARSLDASTTRSRTIPEEPDVEQSPKHVADRLEAVLVDVRPWGEFRQYTANETSTVKIITVLAGEAFSLQRHQYRDELWVVLDDGLRVEVDGSSTEAVAGQEFFIPRGSIHRVSGGHAGGRFLEIAFGRFDEGDIERLDDRYRR